MLKTKRGIFKFMVFTILTSGIYYLYLIHAAHNETNKTCHGDGKKTRGLIGWFFLGILLPGIYWLFIWPCGVVNRWAEFIRRRGLKPRVTGGSFLAWLIFGSLLAGIGLIVAFYKFLHIWNDVNRIYNEESQQTATANKVDASSTAIKSQISAGSSTNAVALTTRPITQEQLSAGALKDDNKPILWILLSIVTNGISELFLVHFLVKDAQKTGEKTGINQKRFAWSFFFVMAFYFLIAIFELATLPNLTVIAFANFAIFVNLTSDVVTIIWYSIFTFWSIMVLILIHVRHQELLVIERHGFFLKHHGRPEVLNTKAAAALMVFANIIPFLSILLVFKIIEQWNQANKLHNELMVEQQTKTKTITAEPVLDEEKTI
jgi:hypothetical protein